MTVALPALTERRYNFGCVFSVALSVGTPRGVAARVYLLSIGGHRPPLQKLRGIAPCDVRTFLLPRNASREAILHPSKTRLKIIPGDKIYKAELASKIETLPEPR